MIFHSRSSSQSGSCGLTISPTIVNDPFKAPNNVLGFSRSGTICPTGLPFLVTVTGSPVAATSSSTARNFALHSEAFMVLVMAVVPI